MGFVTWVLVWVLKFLLDPLDECFVVAIPKSLMGSLEDGSVVTWGRGSEVSDGNHEKVLADSFLFALMGLGEDGSVVTW